MTLTARSRARSGAGVVGEIAARRRADLAVELSQSSAAELRRRLAAAPAPRPIAERLAMPGLHLIAELKRSSPSAGRIAGAGDDLLRRARAYEAGGASVISVLCEPHWFGGSPADLAAVRRVVGLPVLAKEFVVDPRQLLLLRAAGADLVLLLAVLHPGRRLARLVEQAIDLGLEPLVEAHDEGEIDAALGTRARLIGINNRDLRTLRVDVEVAARLRDQIPDDRLAIAESGVRETTTIRDWRAMGFDAALVGEALVRSADPAAAVRAFVAAGRSPADPGNRARVPFVKVCGIVDAEGALAAIRAGVDAIGLNLVPGTPRALALTEAVALARLVRSAAAPGRCPLVVAVTVDRGPDELDEIAVAIEADALQLSGAEPPALAASVARSTWKVMHLPAAASEADRRAPAPVEQPTVPAAVQAAGNGTRGGAAASLAAEVAAAAATLVGRGRVLLAGGVRRLLVDAGGGPYAGGTGRRVDQAVAAAVATQLPVILAGGLDPSNVAAALRTIPAVGVDVASGVEAPSVPGERPRKDPVRLALFVKRARAARNDRPALAVRPAPVHPGLLEADGRGRWGIDREFGGRYVPETLVGALVDLERAYAELRHDPRFWAELRELLATYAGRPTALYRADRLAEWALSAARGLAEAGGSEVPARLPTRLRLYLKREDLAHTGAHKINNALGQALLTRRLGKTRVIAETGAGQHGVATATACALLGLPCVVYMGAEDIRRQEPNVLRMRALQAEVRTVTSGSATLKDAVNEAMRDWVTNVATTHYVLGSAMGPHPYPTIVRDLQRTIGDEAAAQLGEVEGRLPDLVLACVGGGSNAIGLLDRFIGEPSVRLAVSEAAGDGIATGRHAAALAGGTPGILHGARSMMLQDADGQVLEAHSASAGLDYPGVGPQIAALVAAGRLQLASATDDEAFAAMDTVTRAEGILPALESAHAMAALPRLLAGVGGNISAGGATSGFTWPEESIVLVGLSGRGDKDLASFGAWHAARDLESGR